MNLSQMSPDAIPAMSVAMSAAKLQNDIGVAVLAKSMKNTDAASAAMLDMMKKSMELSVNPSIGGNVDISV